ncbi:hypothetical protein DdX_18225 [Ditylenchus destructor]|uniref:Uncharacterized protein n=1 Tax=Ditylenchus destructor TaxID=166010 RepID=A0AAD4ML59_9BILA|nr:hypothetical protein DdX_18225 [Ditylenchus destructor]
MFEARRKKIVAITFIILVSMPGPSIAPRNSKSIIAAAMKTATATGFGAASPAANADLKREFKCNVIVYDLSNADLSEKDTVNALEEQSTSFVHTVSEFLKTKQEWLSDNIESGRDKSAIFKHLYDWSKKIINLPNNVVWWQLHKWVNRKLEGKAECLGLKFDQIKTDNVHLSKCHPIRTHIKWLKMFVKAKINNTPVDGNVLIDDFPCIKKYWGRKWMGQSKEETLKQIKAAQAKGVKVPVEYAQAVSVEDERNPEEFVDEETGTGNGDKKSIAPGNKTTSRSKRSIDQVFGLLSEFNTESSQHRIKRHDPLLGLAVAYSISQLIVAAIIIGAIIVLFGSVFIVLWISHVINRDLPTTN